MRHCANLITRMQLHEAKVIGKGPVISIHGEATVLEALTRMSSYGISSIAVVDINNSLVGNISMADIKV